MAVGAWLESRGQLFGREPMTGSTKACGTCSDVACVYVWLVGGGRN